jgi:aromatic ring hydroxylase
VTGTASVGAPRGAWSGSAYLASLEDERSVWYDGERIRVVNHPATCGIAETLASLYDLQHSEENRETMTFACPNSGLTVSRSYQLPDSLEALEQKWRNSRLWMEASLGQLPRLPDFVANVVIGLYDYRHQLATVDPRFGTNAERYYYHCRDNDLALTHAIVDPQMDRSANAADMPSIALRVVSRSSRGIIVRGAKQLATLAPVSHEVLVYMSPRFAFRRDTNEVVWFAIPMATPGLTVLCREALSRHDSTHPHFLANRYDEQDAMLFFEDVFVPWGRVFLLDDPQIALEGFFRLNAWALYIGQLRSHARLRLFLATATMCAEAIGVADYRPVQDRLGELAGYVEMSRLALVGMNAGARQTSSDLWVPASTLGPDVFAAQITARAGEIVRDIAASGLIMQPSERDLARPELRMSIETYMRGANVAAGPKARLFRLAWDLTADSYGMRQEIYEKWNRGDITANRIGLLKAVDVTRERARIEEIMRGAAGEV